MRHFNHEGQHCVVLASWASHCRGQFPAHLPVSLCRGCRTGTKCDREPARAGTSHTTAAAAAVARTLLQSWLAARLAPPLQPCWLQSMIQQGNTRTLRGKSTRCSTRATLLGEHLVAGWRMGRLTEGRHRAQSRPQATVRAARRQPLAGLASRRLLACSSSRGNAGR
jgi:hypothetical protein